MCCRIAVFLLLLQTCTRVRGKSRGERSSLQLDGCVAPHFGVHLIAFWRHRWSIQHKQGALYWRCLQRAAPAEAAEMATASNSACGKGSSHLWDGCFCPSCCFCSTVACCCAQQVFPAAQPAAPCSQLLQEAASAGTAHGSCWSWYARQGLPPLIAVPEQTNLTGRHT